MKPRIVDAHMHLGAPYGLFTHGWMLDDILELMDELGIYRAYSMHHAWLAGRFEEGRKASLEAYNQSDGRIPFLAVFDPNQPEYSFAAMNSCLGHPGFIGIKIHPSFHSVPADDKRYEVVWDYAAQYNLPIVSHTWSETYNPSQKLSLPKLFEVHLNQHPTVKFVLGHAGGPGNGQQQAIDIIHAYKNAYLDISGDVFAYNIVQSLVEAVGAERVIFGTDQPWIDPRGHIARVMLADIDDNAKCLILRKNALRVFEPQLLNMESQC